MIFLVADFQICVSRKLAIDLMSFIQRLPITP